MKKILFFIKSKSIKLARYFENDKYANEPGFFGLGQFVLLLAIAPFIFNLELYSVGKVEEVASLYEYDANRFEALPVYPDLGDAPSKPKPAVKLNPHEVLILAHCNSVYGKLFIQKKICQTTKERERSYQREKANYPNRYKKFLADQEKYQVLVEQQKAADTAYSEFRPELSSKPKLPDELQPPLELKPKATSSRSFTALIGSKFALNTWRNTGTFIWLLGALLILPAIWLAIRRKCWALLACGLVVPAMNYSLSLLSLLPSWNTLITFQISSSLFAQMAFVWFAIKGHIRSRSFWMFILLLSISVSWAAVLGDQGYSMFQAQLPILVFIIAAIIARLLVKGVQENAYLFVGKGLQTNLFKGAHAFLLWLPMALLAFPILHLTGVLIPKSMVNKLHADKVLVHDYEWDVLDNALISTARKTDDAMFALHMSTQNTKRDIYLHGSNLLNDDLRQRVETTFDKVMPGQLVFEEYESDKAIVGPAIEWSVEGAQESTNKAFINMRNSMKRSVGEVAGEYELEFKHAIKNNLARALEIVDEVHQKGQDLISKANQKGQASLWWSINYSRAIHMLTVLLFVFVCLKSFLYVLARVSFNRDSGTFVTLGSLEESDVGTESGITAAGLSYIIDAVDVENEKATYYISRRFQVRGKAPNYRIPQVFHALFARIFNGAYSMNKVVMQKDDDEVKCTATKGIEFFEWELKQGEIVLFDFHNFVGMSESIEISTHVSTRASSLLLGKMIYSQAMGPGKLILMSEGRAEVTDSELGGGSLPPERIIATQKNTRFHIDSEIDPINIYLSSAYVRPAGGGQVIVDVDSQRGTKTGLGSFIKRFILPI